MRKKILVFILVLAMLLPCVFMFAACNKEKASLDFNLTGGSKPEYASLFSSEDQSLITEALSEDATDEQKSLAAMALFNTANKSRKETPVSLMLQSSDVGIPVAEIPLHGFNLRSGDKWYYQLVAEAKADSDFEQVLYTSIAGLVKVAYSKGDGNYYYSKALGAKANPNCRVETFPYGTFDLIKEFTCYNADGFKKELHYIDSFHEVVNMKFCAEILTDVVITYNEGGYYRVEFSVNMDADSELLSQWFAMVKEDVEVSPMIKFNKYEYYEAVLEVWDNGYAKHFMSISERDAGLASGAPTDEFTFLWVEDEIMQLLHEDQGIKFSSGLNTIEDFIEYYSDPELVSAQLNKNVIVVIVVLALVGVLIIGAIVAIITVAVLLKKGKLPKLAAWLDANKQKRLAKKTSKGAETEAEPNNEDVKPEENAELSNEDVEADNDDVKSDEDVTSEENVESNENVELNHEDTELDNENVESNEDTELNHEDVEPEEDVQSDENVESVNESVEPNEEENTVPEQDNE